MGKRGQLQRKFSRLELPGHQEQKRSGIHPGIWSRAAGPMLQGLSPIGHDRGIQNFPFRAYLLDISSNGHVLLSFDEDRRITRAKLADELGEKDFSWLDGSNIKDFSQDGKTMLFHENFEGSESPAGQSTSERSMALRPFVWPPARLLRFRRMANG